MPHSLFPRTDIPLEVVEHVIDFLHSDPSTLGNFALTCRALLPRTRYHLFRAIKFEPTVQDVDSLCNFFDANPWLAPFVRTIAVYSLHQLQSEVFPPRLLKRLRHVPVRHWKLFTGATGTSPISLSFHWTTLAFLKMTNCVQALDLKGLTINSNVELARLLSSLPLLQVLRCFNVNLRSKATIVAPVYRRQHPSLRTLCVRISLLALATHNTHDKGNRLREPCKYPSYDY